MWPQGGSTSGLNLRFLKKGKPEVDTKTSSFRRGRNCGPDHSSNLSGLDNPRVEEALVRKRQTHTKQIARSVRKPNLQIDR